MSDVITLTQFHAAEGTGDWREVGVGACALFETGSFDKGVALVDAIGRLAEAADHHPDVDLRYDTVTVRLLSHDVMSLSERDVALARQISAAARDLDITADPSQVQTVQFTIDAFVAADVMPFWAAVLGYEQLDEDVIDRHRRNPGFWFQDMDPKRAKRNRLHVDVFVPHDQFEARIAAALAAGGRVVDDSHAPTWTTLADPEGNEVDVATWQGRD